jgi:spore germination protein YaaH
MPHVKLIVPILFSLFAGALCALVFLTFINGRNEVEAPLLKTFGVRKPFVIGFLPYWLVNKAEARSLNMLNRVTYFGLIVNKDGTIVKESAPKETEPGWHRLRSGDYPAAVSRLPSSTDFSLLIHQATEASISALISEPTLHAQNLIIDVEPIMREYGFTDLNLDIESFRVAVEPEERAKMTAFVREVKRQLDEKKLGSLTVELTVASLVNDALMNPKEIGEIADYVVLMAYDFRYSGSFVAGAVAPLSGATETIEYDVTKSVELATNIIPSEKVILGIPLYGYEWETLSYDPLGPVIPGTGKSATALRVKEILQTCSECVTGRDEITSSPYVFVPPTEDSAIQQIYYEDKESLTKKLELAKQHKLGGVAFWAIGYESSDLLDPVSDYLKSY